MKAVNKYTLPKTATRVEIEMPRWARPLGVGYQDDGEFCIWVLEALGTEERDQKTFRIVITGTPLDEPDSILFYLGSVWDGSFARHVFELQDVPF